MLVGFVLSCEISESRGLRLEDGEPAHNVDVVLGFVLSWDVSESRELQLKDGDPAHHPVPKTSRTSVSLSSAMSAQQRESASLDCDSIPTLQQEIGRAHV